jgi:hypothetical protein
MSISTDIIRIKGAKDDLKTAINLLNGGLTTELVDEYAAKLTDADLTAANVKSGVNIFGTAGTFTDDADATAADILDTKTAYVAGAKLTGTLTLDTLIGEPIPQAIIKTVDGSMRPLTIDHYGATVPIFMYGGNVNNTNHTYGKMTGITFINDVTSIGTYAFYNCVSLVSFTAPTSCTSLGIWVWGFCIALVTITIPCVGTIGDSILCGNTAMTAVTLGSVGYPVTSIHTNALKNCTQLGLTITVYVTPGAQPLANSPWGATNATIVYRSAVDGSVL